MVRALVYGVIGLVAGMAVTMAVRAALGLAAWAAAPVSATGSIVGTLTFLWGVGAFTDWWSWARGAHAAEPPHHHRDGPEWPRYLNFDPNHRIIGVQYTVTSVIVMLTGGLLALTFRLELAQPGMQIMTTDTYNYLMSAHGIIMIAAILMGVGGMANFLIPMMIGAPDMAFPRVNALSYWIAVPGLIMVVSSLFTGGFDTGWTGYPPLGVKAPLGAQFFYLGVFVVGLSSIIGSVNYIVTIIKMRAPGMTWFRMPIFVWGMFATALIQLIATQFIGMAFLMVVLERLLGMGFFDPAKGGDVVLFQHIFWFYSHPAVYVFILPGLGVISELLPVFVRKPLFGYKWVALSSMFIALVGFLVWAHHMFATGLGMVLNNAFMVTTLLVAVPTGVKFFSWLATLWGGKITFETPMLFVLGSWVIFLIGGLSGPTNAFIATDLYVHDTYFVVAHFHHTMFGGFVFPFFAAIYYWFPKATGRMYSERLGKIHFWLMLVGFHLMTIAMFWIGLHGMRRRIADYDPTQGFGPWQTVTTTGAYLVGIGVTIFVINMIRSARRGEVAVPNPWRSMSPEWQLPSPPPDGNFETPPEVIGDPYDYGLAGASYVRVAAPSAAGH
ncbi:cytochrome C oxidase subunit I [bacterium]|nr:cytochrome c oxidase subunit I [Chloroflexi bacterium CFX6]RIL10922.1 MAG: cytochrome C oxidase subunit I [bacterium]